METKVWYVTYSYKSGDDYDICTVWVNATDRQDAIDQVRDEYWDVEDIVEVRPE